MHTAEGWFAPQHPPEHLWGCGPQTTKKPTSGSGFLLGTTGILFYPLHEVCTRSLCCLNPWNGTRAQRTGHLCSCGRSESSSPRTAGSDLKAASVVALKTKNKMSPEGRYAGLGSLKNLGREEWQHLSYSDLTCSVYCYGGNI